MEFTSTAKINSLHWITSLHEQEAGVSRRVLEDLGPTCNRFELPLEHYSPASAKEFLQILDGIAAATREGVRPLIHLDLHGSIEYGMLIVATGENIGWDVLADKLRLINAASRNNLCVVSGACFSFQIISKVDINQVVPFFILLAPENEISAGEIEENTVGFYRALLNESDILAAKAEWFPERLRVFHCEEMLAIVLAKYVNNAGMGRQRERRKEELITMAIQQGVPNNRKNLRQLRKQVEQMITPTEELIERFRPTFLAGKQPGFSVAQITKMVERARADGLKAEGPYA